MIMMTKIYNNNSKTYNTNNTSKQKSQISVSTFY